MSPSRTLTRPCRIRPPLDHGRPPVSTRLGSSDAPRVELDLDLAPTLAVNWDYIEQMATRGLGIIAERKRRQYRGGKAKRRA